MPRQGQPAPASIRRIEADGNVLMSSPRETAQGDAGVYDVSASQVTLDGAVVLTRGDNVIRGQRLEVDLASGRSRVFAAVPSTEGGTAPQRVRALFTPDEVGPTRRRPDRPAGRDRGSRPRSSVPHGLTRFHLGSARTARGRRDRAAAAPAGGAGCWARGAQAGQAVQGAGGACATSIFRCDAAKPSVCSAPTAPARRPAST